LARKALMRFISVAAHQGRVFEETSLSTPTHYGGQRYPRLLAGEPKAPRAGGLLYLIVVGSARMAWGRRETQVISLASAPEGDRPLMTKADMSNLIAQQVLK
jgi:hypothetical protein